jgi:hypothetical protein
MRMALSVLATCTAGAEGVDAQLGRVQRDLGRLVGLGHHGHGASTGVDAALAFCRGHTLHAVAAGFEAQRAVDLLAFHPQDQLLVAAHLARAVAHDLGAPAALFTKAQVHAGQVAGKQRRFVTAGAGADFDKRRALVVRVAWQQRGLQFGEQAIEVACGSGDLFTCHLGHLCVCKHLARRVGVGFALLIAAEQAHELRRFSLLARERAVALDVGHDRAVRQVGVEFCQPHGQAFELLAKGVFHRANKTGRARPLARRPVGGFS